MNPFAMNSETIPNYPARKKLSDLSKLRPVVIVDTREQQPLRFSRLASQSGTLQTGDYSFAGGEEHLAIERKSVADLVGCCVGDSRDRFFRELHRLRGFAFRRLLVIGAREEIETGQYRSAIKPAPQCARHPCRHRGPLRCPRHLPARSRGCRLAGRGVGLVVCP